MTKQELLAELAIKFDYVEPEVRDPDIDNYPLPGYQRYVVRVWDISDRDMRRANLHFTVYDEGGPGEIARYDGKEPRPLATPFRAEVQTLIDNAIAANQIKWGRILDMDQENERADVRVIRTSTEAEAFLYVERNSGTGDLEFSFYNRG